MTTACWLIFYPLGVGETIANWCFHCHDPQFIDDLPDPKYVVPMTSCEVYPEQWTLTYDPSILPIQDGVIKTPTSINLMFNPTQIPINSNFDIVESKEAEILPVITKSSSWW